MYVKATMEFTMCRKVGFVYSNFNHFCESFEIVSQPRNSELEKAEGGSDVDGKNCSGRKHSGIKRNFT
jgi:hypothetical protein